MDIKTILKRIKGVFIPNKSPIDLLREAGAIVGENVMIVPPVDFANYEAPLIEIGDWVTMATGCRFILHDSSLVSIFVDLPLKTKFGKYFVKFLNWRFYPNIAGNILNFLLSKIPFFSNHMHLCIVKKQ